MGLSRMLICCQNPAKSHSSVHEIEIEIQIETKSGGSKLCPGGAIWQIQQEAPVLCLLPSFQGRDIRHRPMAGPHFNPQPMLLGPSQHKWDQVNKPAPGTGVSNPVNSRSPWHGDRPSWLMCVPSQHGCDYTWHFITWRQARLFNRAQWLAHLASCDISNFVSHIPCLRYTGDRDGKVLLGHWIHLQEHVGCELQREGVCDGRQILPCSWENLQPQWHLKSFLWRQQVEDYWWQRQKKQQWSLEIFMIYFSWVSQPGC